MKILFSLTYYTPYISGLTLYVKRLARELVKAGHQVSVVSFQHDQALKQKENIGGIQVTRVKPLFAISKGFFSIDWLFKSLEEVKKADTVIVNLPQFEAMIPAFCAKIFGKKLITIYHCEVNLPSGVFNSFTEFLLTVSHCITLLVSDRVVTYTQDFAENSKLLPRFIEKLSYVYPPINFPKINSRIQKMFKSKIDKKNNFIIGIAARLAAEKGIEYLFKAIPVMDEMLAQKSIKGQVKIVIAGPLDPVGESVYKEKIMTLVEKYKDQVVFLGTVKEEEMGAFYSLIDVLVLPSVNSTESFGMVQVEAMMMGVPVVATNLPGVRVPVNRTGMGKIVPIRDSKAFAQAIVEVLENRKRYVKPKNSITKEFDINKTVLFYEKLISITYES